MITQHHEPAVDSAQGGEPRKQWSPQSRMQFTAEPATLSPKPEGKRARDPETQQKPQPKKRREAD